MERKNIFQAKSNSGIRIVGEKVPGAHSVSVGIWVKAGVIYENDNECGISHFIEHMLFKGTASRSAKQIAAEIDAVGGSLNAFTAKENTCYYTRTLGEDLAVGVDILLDLICNPLLAESDIENEKGVVCEEILMGEDDPEDVVHEMLCKSIYEGYPISRPILGSTESVRAITREDIVNYMDRRYRPENIVIACAGDFEPEELIRLVNEKYTRRANIEKDKPYGGSRFTSGRKTVIVQKDVEQAHLCIGLPTERFCGKNAMAFTIISNAFGGATSSRLFQHIREEKGLAYSVYSMNSSYSDTGYLTLYAGTTESKAREVLNCMLYELEKLKKEGLTEAEFERCKQQLRRGYILGLENISSHSQSLGKDMLWLDRVRDDDELLKGLADVTMDDTRKAIDRMLCGDMKLSVVSRNPDPELERIIEQWNC